MSVRKTKQPTKDGRSWVFETRYNTLNQKNKRYTSAKYSTKREALEAERAFQMEYGNVKTNDMRFKALCDKYYEYQQDKVKGTTLHTYEARRKYLKSIMDVKLTKFDSNCYSLWRKEMLGLDLTETTKNDAQKYLKILLNFATRWYGFNFNEVYPKIEPFRNPNGAPKEEMKFFTYDEFKKFISVETDIKFKVAFEILYYCGTRRGELLALPWKYVDFEKHEISIKQNLVPDHTHKHNYLITTPKTKSSVRTIPMAKVLEEDLKMLKEESKKIYGFNEEWFVLGYDEPMAKSALRDRKNKNCKKAEVKQIRLHDFRHSCASLLISKGANITLVARYLGHTKIDETLNTYSHFFKSDLDDIVSRLDDLE